MTDTDTTTKKTNKAPMFAEVVKPPKGTPDAVIINEVFKDSRAEKIAYIVEKLGKEATDSAEFYFANANNVEAYKRKGHKVMRDGGNIVEDRGDVLMAAPKGTQDRRLVASSRLAQAQYDRALQVNDPEFPNVTRDAGE